ncbi:MAG: type II toxin-antitoxin system RelE/ParE family toxin [Fibrobacterales bacterium]
MIINFKDKLTKDLFDGVKTKKTSKIDSLLIPRICRKLDMINAAHQINDLKVPPANFLKKLTGELKEYHSIRINDQWRIIFKWDDSSAHDVQFVDYH